MEGAAGHYTPEQRNAWMQAIDDEQHLKYRLSGQTVAVCETDGDIAGFCSMEANGHLDMMFVHPKYSRQGVASSLFGYLENWALGHGITRIVTEASLTARPFFVKQGFEVIERQTVERNSVRLDNFRMHKNLPASS